MKSGMLAAEAVFDIIMDSRAQENDSESVQSVRTFAEPVKYESSLYDSWVAKELKSCRNSHASFHSPLGLAGGMLHTAFSSFISKVGLGYIL